MLSCVYAHNIHTGAYTGSQPDGLGSMCYFVRKRIRVIGMKLLPVLTPAIFTKLGHFRVTCKNFASNSLNFTLSFILYEICKSKYVF